MLDVYVYEHPLSITPVNIPSLVDVDISINKQNKQYTFYASHQGVVVNENHVIFENRLGRQLGYVNVPMLANSNTSGPYRGKGIQALMLTKIVRHFAAMNEYDRVMVFTYTSNTPMQHALRKAGYTKLYRAKVYRIAGLSVYVKKMYEL